MDIPTKYYIEKEKSKEIISLLRSNNLEISIFDLADELVFTKQTWSKSQILMFFFLGFSIFILCVYNSKKIIIYKLNGYSNINVITSELQSTIWCTILSMISFETVLVFLFEIFQNCGIRFFLYSLPSTLLDCVLMIICIIVPSLIVLFINHASNIKGKKNLLSIKIVSFFMIAAAYVLCIYYSNNSITMFKQVKEMKEFKRNFKIEKLYSLCFNESSRDVDNFFKDFNARCEQLYNILYDENKIVFCYIEENDNKRNSPVLIVNKRYINLLLNYKYISEESFKDLKNGKIIFIPSGIDEEQVNQCKISIPEAELRYYYFEKTFPVFSPLPNNWNGYVRKPIILVIDNPVTLGISPLIMMESDSFFVYDQKKSLNDLLVDTATRSIVSNIKSVSELYGEEIENADITLYEFSFNLIFYLLSFVSIAIFYAIIYFDVEKKKIILKYLLGFKDIHILIDFFLECIIICFIYFLIFDMNVRTFILSIMYEIIIIIIFTIVWKRFRTMRICGILKGEEI